MDEEREYLPLSYLSQAGYCIRRAALLLNERAWAENAETAKGSAEHERVHTQRIERRGDQVKLYEYEVVSWELGLSGKCDCIEATRASDGCTIPAVDFPVRLYPVEYKHGTLRDEEEYKIQLCAQAMCLEETYQTSIPEGALYFITSHRRQTVVLDCDLRDRVRQTAAALRAIRNSLTVPSAQYGRKCARCSMCDYCMPRVKRSAKGYCRKLAQEASEECEL